MKARDSHEESYRGARILRWPGTSNCQRILGFSPAPEATHAKAYRFCARVNAYRNATKTLPSLSPFLRLARDSSTRLLASPPPDVNIPPPRAGLRGLDERLGHSLLHARRSDASRRPLVQMAAGASAEFKRPWRLGVQGHRRLRSTPRRARQCLRRTLGQLTVVVEFIVSDEDEERLFDMVRHERPPLFWARYLTEFGTLRGSNETALPDDG